jgi:formylmethanofuran dehydrogenase subunit A
MFFLMAVCIGLLSCSEKKEGKIIITESEFVVRQDNEKAFVIDAKGKVKNVGDVDVKQLVVTGYCRSCGELINPGNWFVSEYEKTPDQKDTISYLAAGAEEEFSFRGVAFIYNMVAEMPETIPDNMEIVIESFETVE